MLNNVGGKCSSGAKTCLGFVVFDADIETFRVKVSVSGIKTVRPRHASRWGSGGHRFPKVAQSDLLGGPHWATRFLQGQAGKYMFLGVFYHLARRGSCRERG